MSSSEGRTERVKEVRQTSDLHTHIYSVTLHSYTRTHILNEHFSNIETPSQHSHTLTLEQVTLFGVAFSQQEANSTFATPTAFIYMNVVVSHSFHNLLWNEAIKHAFCCHDAKGVFPPAAALVIAIGKQKWPYCHIHADRPPTAHSTMFNSSEYKGGSSQFKLHSSAGTEAKPARRTLLQIIKVKGSYL